MMDLKIMEPAGVVMEQKSAKLRVESLSGQFVLLPRHVDTVAPLSAGIVEVVDQSGTESFVAVNGGLLVKTGSQVFISTPQAIRSEELSELRSAVDQVFHKTDEREKKTRTAMARIEAGLVRKFLEL